MKLHRYVDHQRLHIVTKDVISLSISVLLLFRHYISHKITFGAPSSGGVFCSACGAFIAYKSINLLMYFRTILIANNVQLLSKEVSPMFSAEDVAKIKKFSKQKSTNVFDALGKSLAPSIHGHEYIKKAVLCMLLGGTEKVLANGSRLRGDINVLLIGDPSVAKSQMLR